MKKLMLAMAIMGSVACTAQAPVKRAPRGERPNAEQRKEMMRQMRTRQGRGMMRGRVSDFGKLADGRETKVYRLRGLGGLILDVSNYGGRLVRCYAPDKYGNLADVTLGWNSAAEYEKYGFSAGTLIGRYGNRIKEGRFTLDGVEYCLVSRSTIHSSALSVPSLTVPVVP
jgi:aldose 1-epimerase